MKPETHDQLIETALLMIGLTNHQASFVKDDGRFLVFKIVGENRRVKVLRHDVENEIKT